jgi:TnpA family transposase
VEKELIIHNWDEARRLAASIRHGTVSASLIMRKLASYPKQNQLAFALSEIGKLERTRFVLTYLLDRAMQQRNLSGLNKGEAIHGAARAIAIGQSGERHERELDAVRRSRPLLLAQMNRASSLMLLVAILSTCNTVYLDKVVTTLRAKGEEISDEHLAHVSPLNWQQPTGAV